MPKIIAVGQNFLHQHISMQIDYVIPPDHVIVDKSAWEVVVSFFKENPEYADIFGYYYNHHLPVFPATDNKQLRG
jgi:hypothetical protein